MRFTGAKLTELLIEGSFRHAASALPGMSIAVGEVGGTVHVATGEDNGVGAAVIADDGEDADDADNTDDVDDAIFLQELSV